MTLDPFAGALAALFASPMAVDAIYTPVGGDPLPIRVIWDQDTKEVSTGEDAVLLDTNSVQIQRTAVAQPMANDVIKIDGTDYAVQGGAKLDKEGVTWSCWLEPA